MASVNNRSTMTNVTHEGGRAYNLTAAQELRRTVMSCLLWENSFYENGVDIVSRIKGLVSRVSKDEAIEILKSAKFESKLRHTPLLLLTLYAERGWLTKELVADVLTRPDDLQELLALYWKDGKKPICKQMAKGIALAFRKFDEYQLAKYNGGKKNIKLRDVMRITHPVPENDEQNALWKRLIEDTLATADTWEVAISACGSDDAKKKKEFERLLSEKSLGDLAFLRNLRKMTEVGVSEEMIKTSFLGRKWGWIIPYQFFTAAKQAPRYEESLETAMFKCLESVEKRKEKIAVLVDVSGSMDDPISSKSEVMRYDVASSLAVIAKELFEDSHIYTFANEVNEVPPRKGFALNDHIVKSVGGGTRMWQAIEKVDAMRRQQDLIIVITDEQTFDNGSARSLRAGKLVVINVGAYKNGVSYGAKSLHIDGWSDNTLKYLTTYLDNEY